MPSKDFGVKKIELIGSSGTPNLTSPNNINLNANTVAISTDVSIGGKVQSNVVVGTGYSVGIGSTQPKQTLDVNGTINALAGENKIPFLYANLGSLPNASTYHGMFAHVHSEGKGYFAHSGNWLELVNKNQNGDVVLNSNLTVGVITATSFVGDGSALSNIPADNISNGDKGDITVSNSGTTWTIDNGVISTDKIADDAINSNKLEDTSVTSGSYTNADITVDSQGRITAADNGSVFSGDYNDLTNTPTIPTNTNQLTNGAGFITTSFTNTNQLTNGAGFITTSFTNTNQLINGAGFITTSFTNTNQLTNGAGFITNNVTGNFNVSGNISIGGTLTYEDVTNIDSIGLVTARSGLRILGDGLDVTGVTTFRNHIDISESEIRFGLSSGGGNDRLKFHTSEIYQDTNSFKIIGNTGGVLIRAGGTNAWTNAAGNESYIIAVENAGVSLYHNNSKKFETTSGGIDVTGHTETDTLNVSGISTFVGRVNIGEQLNATDAETSMIIGSSASSMGINFTGNNSSDVNSTYYHNIRLNRVGNNFRYDLEFHSNGYSTGDIGDFIFYRRQTSYGRAERMRLEGETGNLTVTGEVTAANYRSNDTTGDGSDIGFAIKYYITSNGSSAYRFAGPGVLNSSDNPTLYFHRGFTYILQNSTGGNHPFELRVSNGGSAYAPGGSFLTGSTDGTQILTVPFDAPSSIVYQCTLHSGMIGTINFVS